MRVAFYAPMKPLDSPVPSGDRQLGRLIKQALEAAGNDVTIASKLRSWSRHGGDEQLDIRRVCEQAAGELVERWRDDTDRPDFWITYHLYHKAPDWIGMKVCKELDLPYIVVEASRAKKRRTGLWALGFAAADTALLQVDAAIALHEEDAEGLAEIVPEHRLHRIAPFIDTGLFPPAPPQPSGTKHASAGPIRLVTVAMMRRGDKEKSFRILAEALSCLTDLDWSLTIAGDGDARDDLMPLFPADRTTWLGQVSQNALAKVYQNGDVFVWPAVNEAFGLVFLEAQAAGLPVVAGRTGGVPDVVAEGKTGYLAREGCADGFAQALRKLLEHPDDIQTFGIAAQELIAERHTLAVGTMALQNVLDEVMQAVHMNHDRPA